MASLRIEVSLSIPESATGTTILKTSDGTGGITLPTTLVTHLVALRNEVRLAKTYATKINEGEPNEEMTVKAIIRICHHDEGEGHPQCEGEIEI